jgi:hypothetical protein
MCNPLALGLALTAAGTAAQYKAQQDREREMNSLQRAETERQEEIQRKSRPLFDENLAEYRRDNIESEMAAAAANRAAEYDSQGASAPRANEALPGSQQTSNVVVMDAFRRALEDAAARAGQAGQARAQLASFGDAFLGAGLDNAQRTDQLGMLGSFSQGSANVLPFELQHAATRRRNSATIGNLLTGVGTAMAGGAGWGGGGTAAATTNSAAKSGAASAKNASGGANWGALFGG